MLVPVWRPIHYTLKLLFYFYSLLLAKMIESPHQHALGSPGCIKSCLHDASQTNPETPKKTSCKASTLYDCCEDYNDYNPNLAVS